MPRVVSPQPTTRRMRVIPVIVAVGILNQHVERIHSFQSQPVGICHSQRHDEPARRRSKTSLDFDHNRQNRFQEYYSFDTPSATRREEDQSLASTRLYMSSDSDTVNGGSAPGLVTASDAKSQLFSAFTALQLDDQYDAVLTGLCAKILDNADLSQDECAVSLEDPIQLLQEMNQKKIQASPRSLMAFIDATVKTQDAKRMAQVMSQCLSNGGISQYGAQQADLILLPTSPTQKVVTPDGTRKTRAERLAAVADIPTDDRRTEVANALAAAGVASVCVLTNFLGMEDITPLSNLVLGLMVTVGVVDNFYDVLKSTTSFAMSQVASKVDDSKDGSSSSSKKMPKLELPEKDALPLGLGSGQVSGSVVRGLTRLLTVDAERESQCEAAALFAAYALGLPCFAFRPNALESSVLVVESMPKNSGTAPMMDPLLTSAGMLRMLVWLMAPVAMESAKYSQLIMSDPQEAEGLLQRLEDYYATAAAETGMDASDLLWWTSSEEEKADLLKWAYTEADVLLRDNKAAVAEVSRRLTGGAATIGDCIAVIENWF